MYRYQLNWPSRIESTVVADGLALEMFVGFSWYTLFSFSSDVSYLIHESTPSNRSVIKAEGGSNTWYQHQQRNRGQAKDSLTLYGDNVDEQDQITIRIQFVRVLERNEREEQNGYEFGDELHGPVQHAAHVGKLLAHQRHKPFDHRPRPH